MFLNSCSVTRPVYTSEEIDLQFFYDALSPYGYWVHNREYGYVWLPHEGTNFYPYVSKGQWVFTDLGWTWSSGYKWGWAVFHYGRWDFDRAYGWFWFPGTEWSPAWVTWRSGNDQLGWAPKAPDSKLNPESQSDDLYRWTFVSLREFGKHKESRNKVDRRRNIDIFLKTTQLNGGPDPVLISKNSGDLEKILKVTDAESPYEKITGDQFRIFRPLLRQSSMIARASPEKITDLKNVLPANERRKKNIPEDELSLYSTGLTGQGKRDTNEDKLLNGRIRDVKRLYKRKQAEHQLRKEMISQQQKNEYASSQIVARSYEFRKSQRIQRTERQRQLIEKERNEAADMKKNSLKTRIKKKRK